MVCKKWYTQDSSASQYWKDEWVENGAVLTECTNTGTDGSTYDSCSSGLLTTSFGEGYDPDSIMHYGRLSGRWYFPFCSETWTKLLPFFSFTIDSSLPAITWNADVTREFGIPDAMSTGDIAKLKAAYNCPGNTASACFQHISTASGFEELFCLSNLRFTHFLGSISSSDVASGCTIMLSSPYGNVKIKTKSWVVRPNLITIVLPT